MLPLKLGLFMMPVHMPERNLQEALQEDRALIRLADQLGFAEAWMGEHISSVGEPVPSPLIFHASMISEAPNIRFGTGVISLPQHHPVMVASHVALLDQLSAGRVIMGIGSGGLSSDWEIFGNLDHEKRGRAMLESLEIIEKIWSTDPPYHHDGEHWTIDTSQYQLERLGVGHVIKPIQKPFPPVAVSLRGPKSGLAVLAGERGWIPISGNFIDQKDVACHWPLYEQGAAEVGRSVDPSCWRVARSICITDDTDLAHDLINDPYGVFADYYFYLNTHMKLAMGILPEDWDEHQERLEAVEKAKSLVMIGTQGQVTEQLMEFVDHVGRFGTLIMTGHDVHGHEQMWHRSMHILAQDIAPKLDQHMSAMVGA